MRGSRDYLDRKGPILDYILLYSKPVDVDAEQDCHSPLDHSKGGKIRLAVLAFSGN